MPFSHDEAIQLIAACERMKDGERLKALVLTFLYSGLRISDVIKLERAKLEVDGRLLLRMEKTGHPVYVRLPEDCMSALAALPMTGAHFFWDGKIRVESATGMVRNDLHDVGLVAGVSDCHPHRFRDTFSVQLLLSGADIRDVQKLLGHTSLATTERHYAPWVQAMQAKLDLATAKLNFGRTQAHTAVEETPAMNCPVT
jgi:integrase